MSLFEDDQFRWRETYFIMMQAEHQPTSQAIEFAIKQLGQSYEVKNLREDDDHRFESMTLVSPDDNAAMDITYLSGEEVVEQTAGLIDDMKRDGVDQDQEAALRLLPQCNARFDVYHFEQLMFVEDDEEDENMDPGALLIVLEKLAELCEGIVIDPQSGSVDVP